MFVLNKVRVSYPQGPPLFQVHMPVHSGEKPFQCRFCPKAFAQFRNLKAHERIHRGEKPYQCEKCGKRFPQSSAYKNHLYILYLFNFTREKIVKGLQAIRPDFVTNKYFRYFYTFRSWERKTWSVIKLSAFLLYLQFPWCCDHLFLNNAKIDAQLTVIWNLFENTEFSIPSNSLPSHLICLVTQRLERGLAWRDIAATWETNLRIIRSPLTEIVAEF